MMKTVYKLYKQAEDELHSSMKYAENAALYKGKEMGEMYHEMSMDEMKHANYLVEMAKHKVAKEDGEDAMHYKTLSDVMEKEYLHCKAKAKAAIDMY